jgi:hypothetical protein
MYFMRILHYIRNVPNFCHVCGPSFSVIRGNLGPFTLNYGDSTVFSKLAGTQGGLDS